MSYSLDTPSAETLKSEARVYRTASSEAGEPITHGAALEHVAKAHGFRDWNTARAALPDRVASPVQVGNRVKGIYLGQAFEGMVISVSLLADMQNYKVTIKFDEPVDVVTSELFSAFRQRVTATVGINGVSLARTGNGQPQMQFTRI